MSYQKDILKAEDIKRLVSDYYRIDIVKKEDVRDRNLAFVRWVAMTFIWYKTKLTLKQIGQMFGTDHSSVIYARKRLDDIVDTEEDKKEQIAAAYKFIASKLQLL